MDNEPRQALNNGASNSAVLSFQDLLQTSGHDAASDYVSLSITYRGKSICIQITTYGAKPGTYTALIPGPVGFDIGSLLFVAQ
ncbi:MAG: hypothetical protein M0R33_23535 [Methylomonas sp.]|jgi:hypothetical protein|uniref:hypothetical protein n=1 Tax=Methylomonas sp. TaxID=418 RepID=UPI0025F53BC4|nr:hypothetical protein [Methylomonas sp.]MCK9609413.1 hypothetical protein [Methylomonas sp.]